jgi:hypothetical protein
MHGLFERRGRRLFSFLEARLDDAPRVVDVSLVALTREGRIAPGKSIGDRFVLALRGERTVGFYPPAAPEQIHVGPECCQMLLEKSVPRPTGLETVKFIIAQQDLFPIPSFEASPRCRE